MRKDAIFAIASMTKPITGCAVMMLQDEGKLSIEDPVAKFIPELGKLQLADGRPAAIPAMRQAIQHGQHQQRQQRGRQDAAENHGGQGPLHFSAPIAKPSCSPPRSMTISAILKIYWPGSVGPFLQIPPMHRQTMGCCGKSGANCQN